MEKKKALFLKALEDHLGNVTKASRASKVPRSTVYHWKQNDPAFKAAMADASEVALDYVEDKLFELIQEGNTAATIFYLKYRGGNRGYSLKLKADLENKREPIKILEVD